MVPKLSTDLAGSACQVLEQMLGISAKLVKEYEGPHHRFTADISAIIGLTGAGMTATASVQTDEFLSGKFCEAMLGQPPANSDETRDAIGELANIIIGSFKTTLSSTLGQAVCMTVPAVIVGKSHTTLTGAKGNWFALEFAIEGHSLVIEVSMCTDK
jgi:CheY-specific phosphatase CheX